VVSWFMTKAAGEVVTKGVTKHQSLVVLKRKQGRSRASRKERGKRGKPGRKKGTTFSNEAGKIDRGELHNPEQKGEREGKGKRRQKGTKEKKGKGRG